MPANMASPHGILLIQKRGVSPQALRHTTLPIHLQQALIFFADHIYPSQFHVFETSSSIRRARFMVVKY